MRSDIEILYPHIAEKLCLYWDSPFIEGYIDRLFISDRVDRQGLQYTALEDLMLLSKLIPEHWQETKEREPWT